MSERPPLRFGVCYDFRNPPDSGIAMPDLYQAALRQMRWLDDLGLDLVWFTEHHFIDDGYLPAWIPVASAAAAQTRRVRFSSDICLLPFNHPLRLAEDLAVLDNLSNGRVELGVGIGYAPHEFAGFGIPVSRRVSLSDEGLEVLKLCFSGERFSYHGKRYQFQDVQVTPGLRAGRRSAALGGRHVGRWRPPRRPLRLPPAAPRRPQRHFGCLAPGTR